MKKAFTSILLVFVASSSLANTIRLTPGNLLDIAIHNAKARQASVGRPQVDICGAKMKEFNFAGVSSVYNCRLNSHTITDGSLESESSLQTACVAVLENAERSSGKELVILRMSESSKGVSMNWVAESAALESSLKVAGDEISVGQNLLKDGELQADTRLRAQLNTAKSDLTFEIEKDSLLFGWEKAASLYYQCREEVSGK